jgi:hypothetical protein
MSSAQFQDQFVIKILEYNPDGFFLDIGSAHATHCNNSFYLESVGWNGICIEFDSSYDTTYANRNCLYLNLDATKISYENLFIENNSPKVIDYLSLDIDELSSSVLEILPFDEYRFKVITIEHDSYLHGGLYRDKQRDILFKNGVEINKKGGQKKHFVKEIDYSIYENKILKCQIIRAVYYR